MKDLVCDVAGRTVTADPDQGGESFRDRFARQSPLIPSADRRLNVRYTARGKCLLDGR